VIVCRRVVPLVVALGCLAWAGVAAQDSDQPREFPEFRGTWILDETATEGLRALENRVGESVLYDGIGFTVARTVVIATTSTAISVTKDGSVPPETYRFDGTETQVRDPRTGAPLDTRYRLTLVADALALTATLPGNDVTRIITDAYSLREWEVLVVHRTVSYAAAEGHLRTLAGLRNYPQTLIYRRQPPPGR
jgi:hypothetical protein